MRKGNFFRNAKGRIRLIWWLLLIAIILMILRGAYKAYLAMKEKEIAAQQQAGKNEVWNNVLDTASEIVQNT